MLILQERCGLAGEEETSRVGEKNELQFPHYNLRLEEKLAGLPGFLYGSEEGTHESRFMTCKIPHKDVLANSQPVTQYINKTKPFS